MILKICVSAVTSSDEPRDGEAFNFKFISKIRFVFVHEAG